MSFHYTDRGLDDRGSSSVRRYLSGEDGQQRRRRGAHEIWH